MHVVIGNIFFHIGAMRTSFAVIKNCFAGVIRKGAILAAGKYN
jgi:hypothetical protein